jgi:hypothetical protein
MDCFAALAMTTKRTTSFPRRDAPGLCMNYSPKRRGRREDRVRAAPAVSCAMCTKKCAHEHTGSAESIRPSLRNGFTAYSALSPATNSSCHRRLRIKTCPSPVGPTHLRKLDISNGCQDHTTSPYAATRLRQQASPGFGAVRPRVDRSLTGDPPCNHLLRADAAASTASQPAFVTIATRPSFG